MSLRHPVSDTFGGFRKENFLLLFSFQQLSLFSFQRLSLFSFLKPPNVSENRRVVDSAGTNTQKLHGINIYSHGHTHKHMFICASFSLIRDSCAFSDAVVAERAAMRLSFYSRPFLLICDALFFVTPSARCDSLCAQQWATPSLFKPLSLAFVTLSFIRDSLFHS